MAACCYVHVMDVKNACIEQKHPTPGELIGPYEEHAEQWASRIRSGGNWVHEHLEKPAIMEMARFSKGERVVCLGCGSGEEIPAIQKAGANVILGIDLSPALLALAGKLNPGVTFVEGNIANPPLGGMECDVVFSSLAMHYADDWTAPLQVIRSALRPGGRFVFSTHHPIHWSAQTLRSPYGTIRRHGYSKSPDKGVEVWGDYATDHWESDTWFETMNVIFHHKTFSTMIRAIVDSGLKITDIREPLAENDGSPDGAVYSRIPPFILFSLSNPDV